MKESCIYLCQLLKPPVLGQAVYIIYLCVSGQVEAIKSQSIEERVYWLVLEDTSIIQYLVMSNIILNTVDKSHKYLLFHVIVVQR